MALTVDQVYQYSLRMLRKNQSGSFSALEFGDLWSAEQCAYMGDMLGHFQRNNNSKTGLNTGLPQNQIIITKLSPFIKATSIVVSSGQITKPADFQYEVLLQVNNQPVMHINHDQVPAVNDSVIDPPSISDNKYYCVDYSGYYSVLPSTVTTAVLSYIGLPPAVVWGYTYDGQGRQTYAATGGVNPLGPSVQPQWDTVSCREITKRMLKTLGVSLAAREIEQLGDSVINTGN